MEAVLNIVFWVIVIVCSSAVFVTVLLVCININLIKAAPGKKNLSQVFRSFMSAEANHNTGRDFVDLIVLNFFVVLKTNNHGKNFDEKKHLEDFRKYRTLENAATLRKIGEIYGQHFV